MNQYAPSHDQPPKKSCLARFWWLILLVIAVPIVSCVGFGIFAFGQAKKPMIAIVDFVDDDSRVTDKLGSPVEYQLQGVEITDMNINNGSGSARIKIPVKGPNGSAKVDGTLSIIGNEWKGKQATVTFDDGTSIDIPEGLSAEATGGGAEEGVTLDLGQPN
jgi:hypothetical protein